MSENLPVVQEQRAGPPALPSPEVMERLVIHGDLSKLSVAQRLDYYVALCKSLNLNQLTRPFQYIILNNKLTLYAAKDATDQLRRVNRISLRIVSENFINGVYKVSVQALAPDGRTDEASGVVKVLDSKGEPLKGDDMANAMMKAETKAKRRVTLSICGLGWMAESEEETVGGAKRVMWSEAMGDLPMKEVGFTPETQEAPEPEDAQIVS